MQSKITPRHMTNQKPAMLTRIRQTAAKVAPQTIKSMRVMLSVGKYFRKQKRAIIKSGKAYSSSMFPPSKKKAASDKVVKKTATQDVVPYGVHS